MFTSEASGLWCLGCAVPCPVQSKAHGSAAPARVARSAPCNQVASSSCVKYAPRSVPVMKMNMQYITYGNQPRDLLAALFPKGIS